MTDKGPNSRAGTRVTALLFLVVVAANAVSLPFIGTGPWWSSARFWFGRAAILLAAGAGARYIRQRDHRRRARSLERAVVDRTRVLERERARELARSRILEMLLSSRPIGEVLDAVIRLVCSQHADSLGAILRRCGDCGEIAAAPDLPGEWRAALGEPYAVPFEAWREPLKATRPDRHPAWKIFTGGLNGRTPAAIHTWPIGNPEAPLGVLLLFFCREPSWQHPHIAEEACRMARLALEHSRLSEDLRFQIQHDNLTKLPNRVLYEEHLNLSLRDARTRGRKLAVLYIDLDNFKRINDTFSHRVGDLLLGEVANRITSVLRRGDTASRIGGDEFSVVLNDVEGEAAAARIALILEAIRRPFLIEGYRVETTASAGIAIFPEDGKDPQQLERAADAAMYHAKDLGRDRAEAFATRGATLDRARMEEELRRGLRHGWFVVHYQAKVGADRKAVGFEALVRMNHPEHGLVPPMSFIPIAESSGLIVPLGAWVLDEVCRQMADWMAHGQGRIPVAVNVSPAQICRPDFAQSVKECLARHGVSPWNLELELTEGLLIDPTELVQRQLNELRDLGVQLSLDDFGTGYSSLAYLHRLQIDSIKLDRSFVQSIDTDELALRLVQAMVGVAQGLGLIAVAEGVETEAQRTALLGAGCRVMQGFLFARPKPACELEDLLRMNEWDHALPHGPNSRDLLVLSSPMLHAAEPVAT